MDEPFLLDALKELLKTDRDWVPTEDGTSMYIRPFIFSTEAQVGVRPAKSYKFIIILSPVGSYYPQGINPTKIYIEDEYVRAVRGGIGFTKAAANYSASLKAQEKAIKMGYNQVMWLDAIERKYIEEVGTMNVFFLIGDELVTPALEGSILPGITRDSVLELAKLWGIKTAERKISIDELYGANADGSLKEAFGTGTAAVISPIGTFNRAGNIITVADGGIGKLAARMYDTLTGLQYGREKDIFNWMIEIK
jgi:branched-chain amino acid aminotransferase